MRNKEIRRYQNKLRMGGYGVAAFGVWGIIKGIITSVFSEAGFFGEIPQEISTGLYKASMIIAMIIVVAIEMAIRLGVAIPSIKMSRGEKTKKSFLVLAYFLLLTSILSIIIELFVVEEEPLKILVMIIIEMTNAYALVEVLSSVRALKQLKTDTDE